MHAFPMPRLDTRMPKSSTSRSLNGHVYEKVKNWRPHSSLSKFPLTAYSTVHPCAKTDSSAFEIISSNARPAGSERLSRAHAHACLVHRRKSETSFPCSAPTHSGCSPSYSATTIRESPNSQSQGHWNRRQDCRDGGSDTRGSGPWSRRPGSHPHEDPVSIRTTEAEPAQGRSLA